MANRSESWGSVVSAEAETLARRCASWMAAKSVWASRASWRCTHANVANAPPALWSTRRSTAAGCAPRSSFGVGRAQLLDAADLLLVSPRWPSSRRGTRVRAVGGRIVVVWDHAAIESSRPPRRR